MLGMFFSGFLFILMHIFVDLLSLGSAEAYIRWGGKLNGNLMASCVRNICAKKLLQFDNWFSRYSWKCRRCFFGTQCRVELPWVEPTCRMHCSRSLVCWMCTSISLTLLSIIPTLVHCARAAILRVVSIDHIFPPNPKSQRPIPCHAKHHNNLRKESLLSIGFNTV